MGGAIVHLYTPWLDNAKRYLYRRRADKKNFDFSGEGRDIHIFEGKETVEGEVSWKYQATNGKLSKYANRVTLTADLRMLHDQQDSTETNGKLAGSGPLLGNIAHITYSIETAGGHWYGLMILEIQPAAKNISGYWIVSSPIKPGRIVFGDVVLERRN